MINREGFYVTDLERECTKCGTIFQKRSKTVTLCNVCNSERVKSSRTPEKGLWTRARDRAKAAGLEFSITLEDITIPSVCPILGMELTVFSGSPGGRPNSPALDRVDNSKGYIKDNIQVISHLANMMKSSATEEQLIVFARYVLETFSRE